MVERLDDGQLETQLELEKYEQDRQQQEAEGKTTPITISDKERLVVAEGQPTPNNLDRKYPTRSYRSKEIKRSSCRTMPRRKNK